MSDTENGAPEETSAVSVSPTEKASPAETASPAQSASPAEKAAAIAELAQRIRSIGPQAAPPEGEGRAAAPEHAKDVKDGQGAKAPTPSPASAQPDQQRAQALKDTAEVLTAGGAPADLAAAAVAEFGDGAAEQLRSDPWAVLSLPGVRPEHADGFARGLLGPAAGPGDPRRAQALVPWLLEQAALRGHSAVEVAEIAAGLDRHGLPDSAAAIQAAVLDGRAMPFQEELTGPEAHAAGGDEDEEPPTRTLLALERLALAEESLADGLVRLMSTFVPGEDPEPGDEDAAAEEDPEEEDTAEDAESAADSSPASGSEAASGSGAAPTEDTVEATAEATAEESPQAPAAPGPTAWAAAGEAAPSSSATALIQAVADSALVLHTGGEAARAEPAALLAAAGGLGLRVWAATWTDQGRESFAALTDTPAAVITLADLLSGAAGPGRAADGTLALDVLVVLDAPLLDVELAATVLESLADGTRLVLSGDPGQLWSAGPGRFFADLLAARVCPAVASRTPDFGPIGELVSGVGIGELQPVEAPDKEVVILTAKDGGEAVHRALQLLTDSIPRALGIPAEQVVLLTPGHGGPAGTRALNAAAKARLNPGPGRFGGFDPGDRVVDSPAPGVTRPARVLDGDATGLHLAYADGSRRTVPPAQAGRLRHGWALTVHQALGRRWPGAVVVLPEDAGPALTRQWVYTAFGRGERHLSVVHAAGPALAQAVTERPAQPRTTRLRAILAENAASAY
ncbi:helix-hairpin-helix domain-containing protein [Kitasatospora sp. NPDC058243]|uniref:helix-hairpin-helix domain-containing protein n=1 Tax=Kitasatospora sp. NPDC058243 TaxID=3346397 RepID=UPI0036D84164